MHGRGKKRHTGPKAFAAMRQHEVRTTEHNHTPSNKAGQPGRHKSNQIPRGTSVQTARAPHGTNRRRKGSNNRQGGEPTTTKQPRQTQSGPTTDRKEHDNHRKTPATAQVETPTQRDQAQEETKRDQGQRTAGRALRLTPCSIFKVVLFVCSESVIPAVPNREGDRVTLSAPAARSRSSLHLA